MAVSVEIDGLPPEILPRRDRTAVLSVEVINRTDPTASCAWIVGNDPKFPGQRTPGEIRYWHRNSDGSATTGPVDILHQGEVRFLFTTNNQRVTIIGL